MTSIEKKVQVKIEEISQKINKAMDDIYFHLEVIREEKGKLDELHASLNVHYDKDTLNDILISFLQNQHVVYDTTFRSGLAAGFVTLDPSDETQFVFNSMEQVGENVPEKYIYSTLVERDTEYLTNLKATLHPTAIIWVYVKQNTSKVDQIPLSIQEQVAQQGFSLDGMVIDSSIDNVE